MPLESEAFSETHFPWPIGVCASSVHALGFFTPNIVLNLHPVILHCAQFTFASDKVLVADVRIHNSSLKHKRVCLLGGVDSMEGGKWIQTDSGRSSQGQFQNHTVEADCQSCCCRCHGQGAACHARVPLQQLLVRNHASSAVSYTYKQLMWLSGV